LVPSPFGFLKYCFLMYRVEIKLIYSFDFFN
jgi:hypothetical protein